MTDISAHSREPIGGSRYVARVVRWGVAAALAVVGILATGVDWAAFPVVYLAAVTPELARVDLREHRLPNRLVVPGIGAGVVAWGIESLEVGHPVLTPILAAGAFALFLLALCLFGGVGMGDVKLAAALGLASWVPFVGLLSPVIGFLFGGVGSVVLIVRRGGGSRERSRMAFGPYLLAGFWAAVALVAWARLASGLAG